VQFSFVASSQSVTPRVKDRIRETFERWFPSLAPLLSRNHCSRLRLQRVHSAGQNAVKNSFRDVRLMRRRRNEGNASTDLSSRRNCLLRYSCKNIKSRKEKKICRSRLAHRVGRKQRCRTKQSMPRSRDGETLNAFYVGLSAENRNRIPAAWRPEIGDLALLCGFTVLLKRKLSCLWKKRTLNDELIAIDSWNAAG